MLKNLILLFTFFMPLSLCAQIRLATFNIRFDAPQDAPLNSWINRREMIPSMIRFHDFQVFGLQEARPAQLKDLKNDLSEYTSAITGKGKIYTHIFFKTKQFKLLNSGNFWLSPDPESQTKAWDAKFARNCAWVELSEAASGLKFFYFNTHLDHVGVEARHQGLLLILGKVKEIAGNSPVILSGDFNFDQHDKNYVLIMQSGLIKDAFDLAAIRYALNGTTNSFKVEKTSARRIDHIFVSEAFRVSRYGILTDNAGGKFPSDHFPVLVEINKK